MIFDILVDGLRLFLILAAAPIAVSTSVGLLMSILQGATQISDPSLTFVPKVVATGLVLSLLLPWYRSLWGEYMDATWAAICRPVPAEDSM